MPDEHRKAIVADAFRPAFQRELPGFAEAEDRPLPGFAT
jgi:hypothetical protein